MSSSAHGGAPTGKGRAAALDHKREVQRFDLHQRLQHGLMASSFITLVLTGWPLTTHGIGSSHGLVELFGGMDSTALIHRIAGVCMAVAAIYHIAYLGYLARARRLRFSMLPGPKDAADLIGNLMYFLGRQKHRPKFPRYTYFEKFDYWAVFWGVAIMVGSGLLRWYPDATTSIFPPFVYEIGLHAHADEALLASLAIFVWHFYNVHLRPQIFPMSWVFITGRMTVEELKEEHGAEYDEMMAELERSRPTTPPPAGVPAEPPSSPDDAGGAKP
jgi:formate dehydrogenase subunit gamma